VAPSGFALFPTNNATTQHNTTQHNTTMATYFQLNTATKTNIETDKNKINILSINEIAAKMLNSSFRDLINQFIRNLLKSRQLPIIATITEENEAINALLQAGGISPDDTLRIVENIRKKSNDTTTKAHKPSKDPITGTKVLLKRGAKEKNWANQPEHTKYPFASLKNVAPDYCICMRNNNKLFNQCGNLPQEGSQFCNECAQNIYCKKSISYRLSTI
jgi:hypothetical protein